MDLTGKPSAKQSYQLNHRNRIFFPKNNKKKYIKLSRAAGQGWQMFPGDSGLTASAGVHTNPGGDR